jgi:toxin FitB
LLDTNVVSELRKPRPHSRIIDFIDMQPGATLFVTDVTLAEIRYGIETLGDASRRADLHRWLERNLRPLFAGRVLTITEEVIVRWKTLVVEGRKRGRTFSQPDLFIGAIAVLEDLVVVSRDITEFIEAGVPVFDPWANALYFIGKKMTVKEPKLDVVSEIISRE